ncbi:hypothetical protein [Vibrio mangrovi]|uniref:Uncharacterized protein n=1 Tax=Vibrio mangrovi TaxID=474394 RepID=A0A1Y6IN11_9VIBR|nr:hypothetical protein [Vibrio mangrovi]MDW6004177.1 hypothetical protein [Vibrio mangrovi]SMR99026.1 hypothetical protein VIM7927_00248 [Vibrio mangrovi]
MNNAMTALTTYTIGWAGWFLTWHFLIGFPLLKKMKLLHFPFWGAQFVFIVNIVLGYFSINLDYSTELQLYPYVESNAKSVAGMSLAIAVFWVFATKDKLLDHADVLVKLFLWLLFWAFLISVIGTLPLYWVPPGGVWLTALRHIKSVPYFYSLFILASALVVFIYKLAYRKTLAYEISPLKLGTQQKTESES